MANCELMITLSIPQVSVCFNDTIQFACTSTVAIWLLRFTKSCKRFIPKL